MIFRALDGLLLDCRQISVSSSTTIIGNGELKSLLVTRSHSGVTVYATNLICNSAWVCAGHRVFSYKLQPFSSSPTWNKKSLLMTSTSKNLGLTFGDTEDTLYHFGIQGTTAYATRMRASTGALDWSYKILSATSAYSYISHKSLDASKQVLIAATGGSATSKPLKFGRLIIQNGLVLTSDIF